jgi:predicted nuclease of predicted toxin-antitoxin system
VTAFKTDENLPVEAAALLRAAGFDATTVLDQKLGGHPDSAVASVCRLEGRTLVTLDLDFSNIDAYPPGDYAGLVVLRLSRQDKDFVLHVLQALVPRLVGATLAGRLWIVEETRVRERV